MQLIPKYKRGHRTRRIKPSPPKITEQDRYNNVTSIYLSLVDKGVEPLAALDLTNLKVAEKGWTGFITGDKKPFDTPDLFADHIIDWHGRLYPDSLKANNFLLFFNGIEGGDIKYNKYPGTYKTHLLETRPGVKRRINLYRQQQGLDPLVMNTDTFNDGMYQQDTQLNYV